MKLYGHFTVNEAFYLG